MNRTTATKISKIRLISWRDVAGNKYSRTLHPAMVYPSKYRKQQVARKLSTGERGTFEIEYDRDYLITWLTRKVCDPLRLLGVEEIKQLIEEAYEF